MTDPTTVAREIADYTFVATETARQVLVERIEAALTRAREEGARAVWQPIRTAPKDGTDIILGHFTSDGHDTVQNDRWHDEEQCWVDWPSESMLPPTHWRPLAAPGIPLSAQPEPAFRSMDDPALGAIKAARTPVLLLYPPTRRPHGKHRQAVWRIDQWGRLPGGTEVWGHRAAQWEDPVGWLPYPTIPEEVAALPTPYTPWGSAAGPEAMADAEAAKEQAALSAQPEEG